MEPHPIALINLSRQDAVMELLIAALLLALIGVLAQAAGTDSRDADPRHTRLSW
jgi:hypothetical protein